MLVVGDLSLDEDSHEVWRDGTLIELTATEFELLRYLISQASIPEYQVRWRWQPHTVAFWDNSATQHYAVMDYPPSHRKMERAGITGSKPF